MLLIMFQRLLPTSCVTLTTRERADGNCPELHKKAEASLAVVLPGVQAPSDGDENAGWGL